MLYRPGYCRDRPKLAMDPLSEVLSLLKPAAYAFRGLDAGEPWALTYPAGESVKCYAIRSGSCWLSVKGMDAPMRLSAGDFILLPKGQAFKFGSAADIPPLDAITFFSTVPAGEVAVLNGGGSFSGVGGFFRFAGQHAELLLGMLPPVVHLGSENDKAALRWAIERLMRELRAPQPGASLIAEHLAQTLLIETLRLHLAEQSKDRTGWLFALADRQMGSVLAALHAEPGRRWTLQALAQVAGMSRSSFAARFKATVGEPAMEYLTRWRMLIAADRLANTGAPVSVVAHALGYDSDSAFGAAFKRVIGCAPRQFAKAAAR